MSRFMRGLFRRAQTFSTIDPTARKNHPGGPSPQPHTETSAHCAQVSSSPVVILILELLHSAEVPQPFQPHVAQLDSGIGLHQAFANRAHCIYAMLHIVRFANRASASIEISTSLMVRLLELLRSRGTHLAKIGRLMLIRDVRRPRRFTSGRGAVCTLTSYVLVIALRIIAMRVS